jgi:hypothetical protein
LKEGVNLIIVIYSRTIVTPRYNCKGNLRKNLTEKYMRTKNKTLTIAGFEPQLAAWSYARNALDNHATGTR